MYLQVTQKFSLIVSNLKENIREKQLAEIFRQFPGFLNSRMTRYAKVWIELFWKLSEILLWLIFEIHYVFNDVLVYL